MLTLSHQHRNHNVLWVSVIVILLMQYLLSIDAHFIQIDYNNFRANNFPRSPLPTPMLSAELPRQLGGKELSPVEVMVDLSNALTYRTLHYHSILNRNNFAFSPTALMSVLITLYEGSAGRSAMELRNMLQLPSSRDVIRVGYRDIHRRLRTYFFGSENPLKGLSLNKGNVTITRDYETVLMFYGYDLGMDMISTVSPMETPISNNTTVGTTPIARSATTIGMETTTNEVPTNETLSSTTRNVTSTTTATTLTTTTAATTTKTPTKETTTEETNSTQELTTKNTELVTTDLNDDLTSTSTPSMLNDSDDVEFVATPLNEISTASFQRLQKARVLHPPKNKLLTPTTALKLNYLPQYMRSRNGRHKRHLLGLNKFDPNPFVTLFSPQAQSDHDAYTIPNPDIRPTVFEQFASDYEAETLDLHFHNVANVKSNYGYNTDVISHVFYLGAQQLVHTTFKVYNAVLYFKYFDYLRVSVLELELDTPEYNLMILLPDYEMELASAAAALRHAPPLRLMRRQLKPRWVQAIIPDFKLHGIIFLTNDLQNMGVSDVFEPNRADFRPMTEEKGIYIKHIEQSINVNIRTHPINQLKRNYGTQTEPIQISVNHPFLFFIIDRDLDIAVMAGRVLNPLNVRIQ